MSPITPPQPDDGLVENALRFVPVGIAASLVRALLSGEKQTFGWVFRRTIAAGITAWMVGPAIETYSGNKSLALACVGAVSYAAPEVWDWAGKKAIALIKAAFKG